MKLPWFRVYRIRGNRAVHVITVRAKDAESAIAHVAKENGIKDPEQIKRLMARPAPEP